MSKLRNIAAHVLDRLQLLVANRIQNPIVRMLARQNRVLHEDNDALRRENTRLRQLVVRDPLTQLFNRLAFTEHYEAECQRIERGHSEGAVIVCIDMNNFKPINDEYGHNAGDKALHKVGTMLREFARVTDCAARLGGDEFALLLTNCTREGVNDRVEGLRAIFSQMSFDFRGDRIPLTAAIGVSQVSPRLKLDKNMHAADQQMYADKMRTKLPCVA